MSDSGYQSGKLSAYNIARGKMNVYMSQGNNRTNIRNTYNKI